MTARPTLLVLTLGPTGDCLRHPLLPARHRSVEHALRRGCLDRAIAAGRESGFDLEVAVDRDLDLAADVRIQRQAEGSFGERLRTALASVWERKSSAPLILIGSDAPDLSCEHLLEAERRLSIDPASVVLGPCRDGGIYLLAAARPLGDELDRVRWCRRNTRRDLIRALEAAGRTVTLLEPLSDLDRAPDLQAWLAKSLDGDFWRSLARTLRRINAGLLQSARPVEQPVFAPAPWISLRPERGPPVRLRTARA